MAEFVWEARARSGELRKGSMEADDTEAVNERLRSQQLTPTKVKKKGKALKISFGSGVSGKDIVTFTRLFATMIDAGLPIVQCLEILQGQTDNKIFSGVLRDVKASVEQGATFSDSLRRHPKVFDPLYTNLIQAGEVGGILDTIMNRLAVYNEKNMKLKRQVKGAMIYPSSVVVIFTGVLCILLGFVIPSFKNIFRDLGSPDDLPVLTQYVIAVSEAFTHNILWVILFGGAFIYGITQIYKRPAGKRWFHRQLLRMPVMGPVMRKIAVARFTRTCGTLLSSGVPILDALEIVAKTAGNMVVEEAILYARLKISEGKNMAGPLMETNVFPPMVVQMVGVGEQTGALDAMLSKIADFYEDEVDVAVAGLTSLIEPIMMVVIGGTVGVVLISMYLPIFAMAGKIKAG
jgi:type IV pilus assembly protein PilC